MGLRNLVAPGLFGSRACGCALRTWGYVDHRSLAYAPAEIKRFISALKRGPCPCS
jgi:hypothetical protein